MSKRSKVKKSNKSLSSGRKNKKNSQGYQRGIARLSSVVIWFALSGCLFFGIILLVSFYRCSFDMCSNIQNSVNAIVADFIPEYDEVYRQKYRLAVTGHSQTEKLPQIIDINIEIQKNLPHLLIENGYASAYLGEDWWTTQPYADWQYMQVYSATAQTNKDIVLYGSDGYKIQVQQLGIQRIALNGRYGMSSQGEVQKCLDRGAYTQSLRVYYQGALIHGSRVIVVSDGKNCALELLRAGNAAIDLSDKDKLPDFVYWVYQKRHDVAKASQSGMYGI